MKSLVLSLIMAVSLFAGSVSLLIPGAVAHFDKNKVGRSYNMLTPGVGVQYEQRYTYKWSVVGSAMVLADSFGDPMASMTISPTVTAYETRHMRLRIGVDVGIAYKQQLSYRWYWSKDTNKTVYVPWKEYYHVLPAAALTASMQFRDWFISTSYIPQSGPRGTNGNLLLFVLGVDIGD